MSLGLMISVLMRNKIESRMKKLQIDLVLINKLLEIISKKMTISTLLVKITIKFSSKTNNKLMQTFWTQPNKFKSKKLIISRGALMTSISMRIMKIKEKIQDLNRPANKIKQRHLMILNPTSNLKTPLISKKRK